jgi:hypothetical protein
MVRNLLSKIQLFRRDSNSLYYPTTIDYVANEGVSKYSEIKNTPMVGWSNHFGCDLRMENEIKHIGRFLF